MAKSSTARDCKVRDAALQEAVDVLQEWIDQPAAMLLVMGEMTPQEKRSVVAALRGRQARIKDLMSGKQPKLPGL